MRTLHDARCGLRSIAARAAMAGMLWLVASTAFAQAADVMLSLTPRQHTDAAAVQANYVLQTPTRELTFAGDGEVRKRSWHLQRDAQLSADGNTISFARPTRQFTVRLVPFKRDGEMDRVYSPLIAFGDRQSIAVYATYLLPLAGGRISLKQGGTVLGRQLAEHAVAWRSGDAPTYLVLGKAQTLWFSKYTSTRDRNVPQWITDTLDRHIAAVLELYERKFHAAPQVRPWILVTYDPSTGQHADYRGDTNPGMVRLNLMGEAWQREDGELAYRLLAFIAHEFFHLWNASLWAKPRDIWLFEGGADAAAAAALRELGFATATRYASEQTTSLAACRNSDGARQGATIADKLSAGGRAYYNCGAALFYIGAAARQTSPLQIWADMFHASSASRRYSVANFRAALTAAAAPPALAQMLDDIIDSKVPWVEGLERGKQLFHLHTPSQDELLSPALAATFLDNLISTLVKHDCDGEISVAYEANEYNIMHAPSCRHIRNDVEITHFENINMRTDPAKALTSAHERCQQGQDLAFGDAKGTYLQLPCAGWTLAPIPGLLVPDLGP